MTADIVSLFSTQILGNSLQTYSIAFGIFLVTYIGLHFLSFLLKNRLGAFSRKTKTRADDTLVHLLQQIRPVELMGIALYIALQTLVLPPLLKSVISIGFVVLLTYMCIKAGSILLTSFLQHYTADENLSSSTPLLTNLAVIGKALLWVFGVFLILSNIGVDITSLIAGLGIGGIAVALALQNVLGDLFSSFAIYFDKPFLVGDFIIVGDKMGVVERIGIKTTRVRALQGEELVFANKELTEAQIQNFKKMRERRVLFSIGVTYETPPHLLQALPELLHAIIERRQMVRFDRAHFARFDSFALTFEIVYYVLSDDYNTYMDIQQQINFDILTACSEHHISMAYPTQTLYLQQAGSYRPSSGDQR
jgi:small-conductance mechanosensitive channel